ncbi:unnamed protein product [Fraxinus pennsylvanica]|uniref:Pectinesterase inhibitor domain-containing protein n=1 Tax=Fraxinus pennsylvanica TaxID=56036 RepID=A0AAD1ZL81_9LAMI|nr:unnamed protein product [Fraxinus pennsylvanica]
MLIRNSLQAPSKIRFTSAETDMKASDLVSDICSKTRNKSTCLQVLSHKHGANLLEIAHTLTENAQTSAVLAYDTVQVLVKLTKNSSLKERYRSCLGNYVRAIDGVAEWKQYLTQENYQNLPSIADAILKETESCDNKFEQPPSEPSQLKRGTQFFEDICSILMVVSNRLIGGIV